MQGFHDDEAGEELLHHHIDRILRLLRHRDLQRHQARTQSRAFLLSRILLKQH